MATKAAEARVRQGSRRPGGQGGRGAGPGHSSQARLLRPPPSSQRPPHPASPMSTRPLARTPALDTEALEPSPTVSHQSPDIRAAVSPGVAQETHHARRKSALRSSQHAPPHSTSPTSLLSDASVGRLRETEITTERSLPACQHVDTHICSQGAGRGLTGWRAWGGLRP